MSDDSLYHAMLEQTPAEDRPIRLWFALLDAFTSIERVLRRRLQNEFDTSLPRFDVLTALVSFPDGLRMSELAAHLGVTKGNVTGVVRRLSADGWVEQRRHDADRRVQRVRITPAGEAAWQAMRARYREIVEELLRPVPEPEISALTEALIDLQRRLAAAERHQL